MKKELSEMQKRGAIRLSFKKGNRDDLKNYRPIPFKCGSEDYYTYFSKKNGCCVTKSHKYKPKGPPWKTYFNKHTHSARFYKSNK